YYKISWRSLTVPPLRELRDDLLPNATQLLAEHRITLNARAPFTLTTAAADWLQAQDWPGNYAQLSRILLTAAPPSPTATPAGPRSMGRRARPACATAKKLRHPRRPGRRMQLHPWPRPRPPPTATRSAGSP